MDGGSAYGGQRNFDLSALAETEIGQGEFRGVRATENPWRNFALSPPKPTPPTKGGGDPWKHLRPTWATLGKGVGTELHQAMPPPPSRYTRIPKGGTPGKIFAGTQGRLPPRGGTPSKFLPQPSPLSGAPRYQGQESAHPVPQSGLPPPPPHARHTEEGGTPRNFHRLTWAHTIRGGDPLEKFRLAMDQQLTT